MALTRRGFCLGGAALALSACALDGNTDHDFAAAPNACEPDKLIAHAPWALVLSSGGPRGFVHVGVVKALEELKLKPAMIAGASVGALVGALWAAGVSASEIERMALELSPMQIVRVSMGTTQRFSGAAIANLVNEVVQNKPLEALPTRFIPVAAKLNTRTPVIFDAGDTGLAVQASCAIEGQFAPVRIRGTQYIDADLIVAMPTRIARVCGAQRVLSVDASAHETSAPTGAERYRAADLRKRAITEPDARAADFNLHPKFAYYVSLSDTFRRNTIAAGYEATMVNAPAIRAALGVQA